MPPSDYISGATISDLPTLWDRASASRGLGERPSSPLGVFSQSKSHAILAVGIACASISLVAATISLRWFLLMRRSYRHHLILFLIISDTWKSLWYFIYPIVAFARGHIQSSSKFCQASGFLLSVGLETSDFAILMIALHTILYVFKRPQIKGEGGLYPYRKYIYPLWLGLPLLSAGLAFTNSREAYVTSGTFCYLPKRPFWYRLALAWIPRYMIFVTIFSMYAVIWVYVQIKFRGFKELGMDNSRYASGSESQNQSNDTHSRSDSKILDFGASSKAVRGNHRKESANSQINPFENTERPPWENVSFITSKPLHDAGVTEADFAPDVPPSAEAQTSSCHPSIQSQVDQALSESRKHSEAPTLGTNFTEEIAATAPKDTNPPANGSTDQLKSTRSAIRRQLRLLFIYPLVYLLMWTFPFASHCLNYSDYWAAHPPILAKHRCDRLALPQAGVDCAIFSWRERPWNRIDESSRGSWTCVVGIFRGTKKIEEGKHHESSANTLVDEPAAEKQDSNWWEAEGKRRKDSVWMGTDALNQIISRQEQEENGADAKKET